MSKEERFRKVYNILFLEIEDIAGMRRHGFKTLSSLRTAQSVCESIYKNGRAMVFDTDAANFFAKNGYTVEWDTHHINHIIY